MSHTSDFVGYTISRAQATAAHRQAMMEIPYPPGSFFYGEPFTTGTTVSKDPMQEFDSLKRSVKQIEAEPFSGEVRRKIEDKIGRLQKAGAVAQACVLEKELSLRAELVRLKEWDYKLLTKETIDKFQAANQMTMTRDGLKIHIDPLEKYSGNPANGHPKNQIIPDDVLDAIEAAKERELFDELSVLWAEKVKDPLILGSIHGCEDYFFICEWGDDITFEQLTSERN